MYLRERVKNFIKLEVFSSVLLIFSLMLALILSNSPLNDAYMLMQKIPIQFSIGTFHLNKPAIIWLNEGLMALFFLLLTIEAKFHCLEGAFQSSGVFRLPILGAIGGAIVPPIIYIMMTNHLPSAQSGWAIPIATDTAFVLGVLAFFSNKISLTVRLFIVALSIIDDFIAIMLLALFFSDHMQITPLLLGLGVVGILYLMNRNNCKKLALYMMMGVLLWLCLIHSGIHGTITGVILGLFIPLRVQNEDIRVYSPLKSLERNLHPFVAYILLPTFAFLNGGIDLSQMNLWDVTSPISMGIICGLFFGKQIGIMAFTYVGVKMKYVTLPGNISWATYYGIAILCGIGFTFSIFIGLLSFDQAAYINQMKIGVILASFLSTLAGVLVLRFSR
ncbi:MAG: Na+/H+ antiporter NhaA [Alphaproteobacteria bacterium]|nr:Na+/H+ antiporter NhaA [Alphaproteobacteria bacterium]